MVLTPRQKEELHKAIADYLFQCGFEDALNAFKKDANMVSCATLGVYLVHTLLAGDQIKF